MKLISKFATLCAAILLCATAISQPKGYEVFNPICKYLALGDAENLSAWFDDRMDVSVLSAESNSSRNQATQIVKSFFESYTPRSFEMTYTAGRANMKYVLGNLNAGGEMFRVTIFVSCKDGNYKIQQLKIERN